MVKHWFNCKVSSRSLDSEGAEVKKLEQFVLDAYTYTCLLYTSDAADD